MTPSGQYLTLHRYSTDHFACTHKHTQASALPLLNQTANVPHLYLLKHLRPPICGSRYGPSLLQT